MEIKYYTGRGMSKSGWNRTLIIVTAKPNKSRLLLWRQHFPAIYVHVRVGTEGCTVCQ